ncbi:MAG TPA: hypothetical protein VIT23_02900 [Terrimicrobiaceae bacterium]
MPKPVIARVLAFQEIDEQRAGGEAKFAKFRLGAQELGGCFGLFSLPILGL